MAFEWVHATEVEVGDYVVSEGNIAGTVEGVCRSVNAKGDRTTTYLLIDQRHVTVTHGCGIWKEVEDE